MNVHARKTLSFMLALSLLVATIGGCASNSAAPSAAASTAPSVAGTTSAPASSSATKFPERPINAIVPFGAGGATDLIGRSLCAGMEKYLDTTITVNNMPGSASAVGNEYVFDADHDGYTVLVQPTDITSVKVMGQSQLTYKDWEFLYIAAAVPTVFAVKPDSPLNNVADLVAEMKSRKMTIATSDAGCAFTRAIGMLLSEEKDCQKPELIPSGGGNPAAISCIKGDVEAVACGLPECIDLIRSGDLKGIAYWGKETIVIKGADGKDITIRGIVEDYPQFKESLPFGGWVSMAVAKDTDPAVVEVLRKAVEYAANQPEYQSFLESKTFVPVGLMGEEANKWAEDSTYTNAWLLYDMGFASTSPETLGWPHP